jgi:hypothetical protein
MSLLAFGEPPNITPISGDFVTVWAGPGGGKPCSSCNRRIEFSDVECEVELRAGVHITALRFHADCYSAWFTSR